MIHTSIFLLFTILITSCHLYSGEKQPNVLFIAVDDWNDYIGAYGDNPAVTPHLDRLTDAGVSFTYAHSAAVYCAPSRTSVMTGLLPSSSGCYGGEPHHAKPNIPEFKDLPIWFRDNGYYVTGGGKLYHHMPGYIDMRGWNDYFIWDPAHKADGWRLNAWHGPNAPLPDKVPATAIAQYLLEENRKRAPDRDHRLVNGYMEWGTLANKDEERMADTILTNWAADFLRNRKAPKNEPFFLGFGLYAPHKPNYVPAKYFELYPLETLEMPYMDPNDLDDLPPSSRGPMMASRKRMDSRLREFNELKLSYQAYLAALSYADAMIGRVLEALNEGPYADNTIVVVWSDNGYHLGEKYHWSKHTLWERTSNVPFIWAGPGIAKGKEVATTVSLLDIYPTLVELCGLPENPSNDGISLADILRNPETAEDRTLLQIKEKSVAVINTRNRYIRYANGDEELYDVVSDPMEITNLAQRTEFRETMDALADCLPASFAPKLRGPGEMVLVKDGDEFEWRLKKKSVIWQGQFR